MDYSPVRWARAPRRRGEARPSCTLLNAISRIGRTGMWHTLPIRESGATSIRRVLRRRILLNTSPWSVTRYSPCDGFPGPGGFADALHSRQYLALRWRCVADWSSPRARTDRFTLPPAPRATWSRRQVRARAACKRGAGRGPRCRGAPCLPRVSVCRRAGRSARPPNAEMSTNGSVPPEPRLCHVRKTPNFDGYGFNLHAEKGKPGQYIGKVDEGSPAETAGLYRGDRILEVNGHSIAGETHKQVVARIKERSEDAELLVIAPAPGDPVPELDAPERARTETDSSEPARDSPPPDPPRLNLQMTAAEMRAHLAAKKKFDPKKVPMDLKSKFDIVKKL